MLETIIEHGPPVSDRCANTETSTICGDGLFHQQAADHQRCEDDLSESADDLSCKLDEQMQLQSLLAAADNSPSHDAPADSAHSPRACNLPVEVLGITSVYGSGNESGAGRGDQLAERHASDQRADAVTADGRIQSTEPRVLPSVRWNLIDAYSSQRRDQPGRVGVLCSLTTPSAPEARRPKLQTDLAPGKAYQTQMSNRQQARRPSSSNRSAAGDPPIFTHTRRPDWQSGNHSHTAAAPSIRRAAAGKSRLFDEDNLEQVSLDPVNHANTTQCKA